MKKGIIIAVIIIAVIILGVVLFKKYGNKSVAEATDNASVDTSNVDAETLINTIAGEAPVTETGAETATEETAPTADPMAQVT